MLLKFSVENFLSIRDEVELTFLAAPLKEHKEHLVASRYAKNGVVPIAVLYGANASGKSNLLAALSMLRRMVLRSFIDSEGEAELPYRPFLLDEESKSRPTKYVLDFILEDARYQYGVINNRERVCEEWLFSFPNKIKQVLYSRNVSEAEEFYFGRALSGNNRQIQAITKPHVLFLSAAATTGHQLLTRISTFFKESLVIRMALSATNPDALARSLEDEPGMSAQVVQYLAHADTGITDVKVETQEMTDEMRMSMRDFVAAISKVTKNELKTMEEMKSLKLGHSSGDGKIRYIDFADESLGTRHLFAILPPVLIALKNGSALVLDEITTSLHTLLAQKLVGVFKDTSLNTRGAQLIFSTHDTNLLSPGLLRRDEIWFAEKSSGGVTTIFPLTDVKTKNTDNIERGYIQGRFGAIPFVQFG